MMDFVVHVGHVCEELESGASIIEVHFVFSLQRLLGMQTFALIDTAMR